jgi:hypothetical protein
MLHFKPALFYLAEAGRHGAWHLIQLSVAFLRRNFRRKSNLRLSTKNK